MDILEKKIYHGRKLLRYKNSKDNSKGDKMNKKIIMILGFVLFCIDQITKYFAMGNSFTIVQNFVSFTYSENSGIAFGLNQNNIVLTIIINIVILGIIIKFLKENINTIGSTAFLSFLLILAGGFGNLIDRIFHGHVIDFIKIELFDFPIFNFADIYITIGVIILMIIFAKELFKREAS